MCGAREAFRPSGGVADATRTYATRTGGSPVLQARQSVAGQPAGRAREASRIRSCCAARTRSTSGFITRRS
ncbi:hypothetical protein SUDANB60_05735 [Streptomyces sp. enrichment culture]